MAQQNHYFPFQRLNRYHRFLKGPFLNCRMPCHPKTHLETVATLLRGYGATRLESLFSYTARKLSYLESVATRLRGYAATWLRSCVVARLRGCAAARLRGCAAARLRGCGATRLEAKLGARYFFFTLCFCFHV